MPTANEREIQRVADIRWLIAVGIDPVACGTKDMSNAQLSTLVNQINDAITRQVTKAALAAGR